MLKAVALICSVALAFLYLCGAFFQPFVHLPIGLLFALASWGIHRGRFWSACGAAMLASILVIRYIIITVRQEEWLAVGASVVPHLIAAVLLVRAALALPRPLDKAEGVFWCGVSGTALVCTLFLRLFVVPTSSMDPTVLSGDHILTAEPWLRYGLPPQRGAVLIARALGNGELAVRRVAGVPGDRIKIVNKELFVNGSRQAEPYTQYIDSQSRLSTRDDFPPSAIDSLYSYSEEWTQTLTQARTDGEVTVPPGKYFLLGDNRDNSLDSRFLGFVDRQDLAGAPLLVLCSFKLTNPGLVERERPPNVTQLRWDRILRRIR